MGILQFLLGRLPAPDVTAILVVGIALFAVSWIRPRRIVALPDGRRRRTLTVVGVGGSVLVLAAATTANILIASLAPGDATGYSGWWMRPLALGAVVLVLSGALAAVASEPRPLPGARAFTTQRRWQEAAPRGFAAAALAVAGTLGVTVMWQMAIATTPPQDGNFYGRTGAYVDLPIWMSFNNGTGYVSGVGWPNHLATAIALVGAAVIYCLVLIVDARRPLREAEPATVSKLRRSATARILMVLTLAGVLATFGAVWSFVGFTGRIVVGLGDGLQPDIVLGTGYAAFAQPMQLIGLAAQAVAVAVLLRLVVDTVRAAREPRRHVEAAGAR